MPTLRWKRAAPASKLPRATLRCPQESPGTDNAKFQEIANKAKTGCPVSKLLKAQITMDAKLET
jgi:osmotically inducible protein OsmC